jgi:hypothetical protein
MEGLAIAVISPNLKSAVPWFEMLGEECKFVFNERNSREQYNKFHTGRSR